MFPEFEPINYFANEAFSKEGLSRPPKDFADKILALREHDRSTGTKRADQQILEPFLDTLTDTKEQTEVLLGLGCALIQCACDTDREADLPWLTFHIREVAGFDQTYSQRNQSAATQLTAFLGGMLDLTRFDPTISELSAHETEALAYAFEALRRFVVGGVELKSDMLGSLIDSTYVSLKKGSESMPQQYESSPSMSDATFARLIGSLQIASVLKESCFERVAAQLFCQMTELHEALVEFDEVEDDDSEEIYTSVSNGLRSAPVDGGSVEELNNSMRYNVHIIQCAAARTMAECQRGDRNAPLWLKIITETSIESEFMEIALCGLITSKPLSAIDAFESLLRKAADIEWQFGSEPDSVEYKNAYRTMDLIVGVLNHRPFFDEALAELVTTFDETTRGDLAALCSKSLQRGFLLFQVMRDGFSVTDLEQRLSRIFTKSA